MKPIIKLGGTVLREYNRLDATLSRKPDGGVEQKIHVSRKKTHDTLFEQLFNEGKTVHIRIYEDEEAFLKNTPVQEYLNMFPVEFGIASNPPNFAVQERLVYEPRGGTYEDPEEDEPEEDDPDVEEDPEEEPEEPEVPEEPEESEVPEEPEEEPEENDPGE